MTERLYYDQSYLKEFEARVTAVRIGKGSIWVSLDRSAFYPTSGGQPFDTGILACGGRKCRVTDVQADEEGEVWHLTDAPLYPGDTVTGYIDWDRRFDHMQQHGGEHMIAGAVYTLFGGMTIGLHLGEKDSSIDVTMPDGSTHFTDEMIEKLETDVNTHVQQDAPVRCWFPDAEELQGLPLRKAPTVREHVRIVAFGDYEMVACGGTHPSSAGQVGPVRILSVTPARGKARVTFVCGMRAYRYMSLCTRAAERSARLLSCRPEELPGCVETLNEKLQLAEKDMLVVKTGQYLSMLEACGGVLSLDDGDVKALQEAVSRYIEKPGRIALAQAGRRLIFARSADAHTDMAALLRQVARGGGRPDFASGDGEPGSAMKAAEILTKM